LGCSSGAVSLPSEHDNSFLSSAHNNSSSDSSLLGVAPLGSMVAVDGFVKFDATLSGAVALGECLGLSLPMTSEFGAPIYPSESKSVPKLSRKQRVIPEFVCRVCGGNHRLSFSAGSPFFVAD
jgi:hypothetical protein